MIEDKIIRTHIENVVTEDQNKQKDFANTIRKVVKSNVRYPHECAVFKECCKLNEGKCTYNNVCKHLESANSYMRCNGKVATPNEVANGMTMCYSWRAHLAHPDLLMQTWLLARFAATTIRLTEVKVVRDIGQHVLSLEAAGHVEVKTCRTLLPMKGDDSEQHCMAHALREIRKDISKTEMIRVKSKTEVKMNNERICNLEDLEKDFAEGVKLGK
jgi:hypothetical protein